MKKLLRGLGCLGYLCMLLAISGFVAYMTFNLFVRRGVTPTPDLTGLSQGDARALLTDQGLVLTLAEGEDRFAEGIPAGHVLLHRPRAGTLVKRGSAVSAILSRGPQRIKVPPVVGEAPQAAQVTLAAAGLILGRSLSIFSPSHAPGTVVAQWPQVGTLTEANAPIDLLIARENTASAYVMPDLVYRHFDEVRRFFEGRDFRLGRVSYETYAGLPPGTVVRQFPLAGHALRQGDVISLGVVASEPEKRGGNKPPNHSGQPERERSR